MVPDRPPLYNRVGRGHISAQSILKRAWGDEELNGDV
jgi:hypothetical protein